MSFMTFMMSVSYMLSVPGYVCSCVMGESYKLCVLCVCGWIVVPEYAWGAVVGTQGEGGRVMSIPDRGGVRWSLFGERRIGDGV